MTSLRDYPETLTSSRRLKSATTFLLSVAATFSEI